MAMNFPTPATQGDIYIADNGITYTYDGVKWIGTVSGSSGVTDRLVSGGYEVVLDENGNLDLPDGGEIWFNYGYIDQDADVEGNALRVSGGNCVVIHTAEDSQRWLFDSSGNLTLPQTDFLASPAPTTWPGITFSDGTFQNTASLYRGNTAPAAQDTAWYNTEDGRLYVNYGNVWTDASPSIIPGNMVAYESNGNIELRDDTNIVFSDGTAQATAGGVVAGNTAPGTAQAWYNTDDGRTYNYVDGAWVDANPTTLPGDIVTFNEDGNITLPAGGTVTYANGRSILQGITATGGGADTGDISFEGVKIIGSDSDLAPVPGLIQLVPIKESGGVNFESTGQYLEIYPTIGYDHPHIHVAAGSGGDLILGSDSSHLDVNSDGNLYLKTNSQTYAWTFDNTGSTELPGNLQVGAVGTYGNISYIDTIRANTYAYANGVSILLGITASGNYGDSNVAAYLSANPQPGTYSNSNVASYLTDNPQPGTYGNTQVDAYLVSGSLETAWVHGNLTVGNLVVNGTSTYINTQTYTVDDNIIQVANANPANSLDIGFVGHRTVGSTLEHTGFVRDASDNKWRLFSNITTQPGNTVDFANAVYDDVQVGSISSPTVDAIQANIGAYQTYANATFSVSSYSNTNVAAYLSSQNISSANIGGSQTYANIQVATLEANVGSFYTWANASYSTNTYSNTNVAAYLTTATINTTGNITGGNVIGTHYGNAVGTTATYSGNVTAANFIGTVVGNLTGNVTGNLTGNVTGTTPNVSIVAGSYTTTIDNTGRATFPGNIVVNGMALTMPARPAFRIYGSGVGVWATTSNVNLKGTQITVDYNTGSYFNSTTGKFTAPVAGLYTTTLVCRVGSNNGLNQVAVLKNGLLSGANIVCFWETDTNTGSAMHFGTCGTVNLAAGDFLSANIISGNINFDGNDSWTVTYLG